MTYYLRINKSLVDNYELIFFIKNYSYSFFNIKIILEILNNLIIFNYNCNFFSLFKMTIREFVIFIMSDF